MAFHEITRKAIPKDLRWNREHLVSAVLQGIMQGESVGKIATRVQAVAEMDRRAALRNARTMVTCAQNSGRQAAYDRGEKKGIHGVKQWVAAHDERVIASHAAIDGEQVETDKRFSNGLMYPGDKSGAPAEVYNCRCAMVYRVASVDLSAYVNNDPQEPMSYQQWEQQEPSNTPPEWNNAKNEGFKVSRSYWDKTFADAINGLSESAGVKKSIIDYGRRMMKHRDGTEFEDLIYVNSKDNTVLIQNKDSRPRVVSPNYQMRQMALKNPDIVIGIHNHPGSSPPSNVDLMASQKYKYGLIFNHNGGIFKYKLRDGADLANISFLLEFMGMSIREGKDITDIVVALNASGLDFEVLL